MHTKNETGRIFLIYKQCFFGGVVELWVLPIFFILFHNARKKVKTFKPI